MTNKQWKQIRKKIAKQNGVSVKEVQKEIDMAFQFSEKAKPNLQLSGSTKDKVAQLSTQVAKTHKVPPTQ